MGFQNALNYESIVGLNVRTKASLNVFMFCWVGIYLVAFEFGPILIHCEHEHDSKVVPKMDLLTIQNGIVLEWWRRTVFELPLYDQPAM